MSPRLPGLVAVVLLLAACVSGGSEPPAATPSATPTSTAAPPTPTEAPRPTPTGTATAGFDPNRISVTLEPFAIVDGSALAITNLGDGSNRLVVATQEGQLYLLEADGTINELPILDLEGQVSRGYEQGLLGVAVHPEFPEDPRIFVDITDLAGDTVVRSYRYDEVTRLLDPATAVTILTVDQPYPNHNGGALAFGPDGYLHIALGDGGASGDPQESGEHLDTLLAKILRIDVDNLDAGGPAYGIPGDNPFIGVNGARPEIWLTGLRNPWKFSFDRGTGDLWIGDVGQEAWEEVDVARQGVGGLDFGWDRMEGAHCFEPMSGCVTEGLTLPVTEYGHDEGCTIIGGVVYRGTAQPDLVGGYLFGDYCSGRLWAIAATTEELVAPVRVGTTGSDLAGFGEDEAGEVYVAQLDGTISRVVATPR